MSASGRSQDTRGAEALWNVLRDLNVTPSLLSPGPSLRESKKVIHSHTMSYPFFGLCMSVWQCIPQSMHSHTVIPKISHKTEVLWGCTRHVMDNGLGTEPKLRPSVWGHGNISRFVSRKLRGWRGGHPKKSDIQKLSWQSLVVTFQQRLKCLKSSLQ